MRKIVLFIFGLSFAFLLSLFLKDDAAVSISDAETVSVEDDLLGDLPLETSAPVNEFSPDSKAVTPPSKKFEKVEAMQAREQEQAQVTSKQKSAKELVEQLRQDIKTAEPDTFKQLSPDNLKDVPAYEEKIRPLLKKEMLSALLSRFNQKDWDKWGEQDTSARKYVAEVLFVNKELGSYLQTAATLFSALYSDTSQGKRVDAASVLENIAANCKAENSPACALDKNLLQDPHFIVRFERLRLRFVLDYVRTRTDEPVKAFSLLLSLDSAVMNEQATHDLALFLRRFSVEATPKFRAAIFREIHRAGNLDIIAANSDEIKTALANLYLVGAMDAIDAADYRTASVYLNESEMLKPGLRTQEIVANFLNSKTAAVESIDSVSEDETKVVELENSENLSEAVEKKPLASPKVVQQKEKPGEPVLPTSPRSSIQRGVSYFFIFLFILVLGGGGVFYYLYWKHQKTNLGSHFEPVNFGENRSVRMTSPSEMDFGEELQFGNQH